MQTSKGQLREYASLPAKTSDRGGAGMVCDRCLQEIDAETFSSNVARLEKLTETAFDAQAAEDGRALKLEVGCRLSLMYYIYIYILLYIISLPGN